MFTQLLSLFWGYFFRRTLYSSSNSSFRFISCYLFHSFLLFIGKNKFVFFFSFYYHFSLSIKKKYGGEMLLWILFMDRCLPVLHGIHFTFVVVEEQFFFSKIKIFFFLFQTKNNHNNSSFLFFPYTPSHPHIHPLHSHYSVSN